MKIYFIYGNMGQEPERREKTFWEQIWNQWSRQRTGNWIEG